MGIASMILGILSMIMAIVGMGWPTLIPAAAGIVLGAIARKNREGSMATAGFVLSIVGASFGLLNLVFCYVGIAIITKFFKWIKIS